MDIVDTISKLFWDNFPISLLVFVIPLVIFYFLTKKEKARVMFNRVEVFFKGGTKDYFPCIVSKDNVMAWEIEGEQYIEPITHNPRIWYDEKSNRIYRDFMYAEGIGSVDIPPLTAINREKILAILKEHDILPKDYGTNLDDEGFILNEENERILNEDGNPIKGKLYSDEELIQFCRFWNFDIEQITDMPILRSFSVGTNFFVNMIEGLISRIRSMEPYGTTNTARIAWIAVGILIGWGFSWAFALKGWI